MATKFKLKSKNGNGKDEIESYLLNENSKAKCGNFLLKAKLAVYMKRGLDIKDAAKLCRISDYRLGQLRSDPEFEEFVEQCSTNCELQNLANISDAGSIGQWQASAWILERKFPEKYSKKDTVRHEYEIKLMSFRKLILNVINELDTDVRHQILQKLRNVNIETEADISIENAENNLIEMDIAK